MRAFACPVCNADIFFNSTRCESCGSALLFSGHADTFVTEGQPCANAGTATRCNWSCPDNGPFCPSCVLDVRHGNEAHEVPFQEAKRRTLRQLLGTGVRVAGVAPSLRFDLRSSTTQQHVVTGHADGLITIDTAEGDPVQLAETQASLGEPYRTPLGHIRHELGHWFWASAVDNVFAANDFRALFGDEGQDYNRALQEHYAQPDDGAWRRSFLSHYASAHPWEDFAESFAHVLHMDDTLETAATHNLIIPPETAAFGIRYQAWIKLAVALNALNRSMGTPDPYPFVVPPPAVDKLRFVDSALRSLQGARPPDQ